MIFDRNLVVCLTGAAGQIAYALLPSLCDGSIFGAHQVIEISINLRINIYRKLILDCWILAR